MPSFFSLHVAMSGLRAHQYAMSVTAHNIANAGTQGYHRQEARFMPGNPLMGAFAMTGIGIPQLGTGVMVNTVERMRSDYIDSQIRMAGQWAELWSYKDQTLKQIESLVAEPGELGLSNALNRFWNAWEELSVSPESLPSRISVIESGVALSLGFGNLYSSLRQLQARADQDVIDNASRINAIAHEIAHLNEQITRSNSGGFQPNDLLDQRDMLLDKLASITQIQVHGIGGSDMFISISGKTLVQGHSVNEVAITPGDSGRSKLVWAIDGTDVQITGGALLGQLQIRDGTIEDYIARLNTIASTIVDKVNAVHATGITLDGSPAGDFFVPGTNASNMEVAADTMTLGITSPAPDDVYNSLPKMLAAIRDEILIDGETINGAYLGLVSRIGAQSREAASRSQVQNLSLQQLNIQRESISGVSIDEEMLNMVKFQQAYNAAARITSVIDEMIETVISHMGVGGR